MTAAITHEQWQAQVVELAHTLGWSHLHVRRSIGKGRRWTTTTNLVGWPDLLLWAPGRGFVAIELKVHPDTPNPAQLEVLASLDAAGARTMVAYPNQLEEVAALLTSSWRAARGAVKGPADAEPAEVILRQLRGAL